MASAAGERRVGAVELARCQRRLVTNLLAAAQLARRRCRDEYAAAGEQARDDLVERCLRSAMHARAVLRHALAEALDERIRIGRAARLPVGTRDSDGGCRRTRSVQRGAHPREHDIARIAGHARDRHQSRKLCAGIAGSSRVAVHADSGPPRSFAAGPRPRRARRCARS
jgi:hypothetical protein